MSLVAQFRHQVLPLVCGALETNAAQHWNPAVHGLTCNVRKMFQVCHRAARGSAACLHRGNSVVPPPFFQELDEPLYEQCRLNWEHEQETAQGKEQQRRAEWERMQVCSQTFLAASQSGHGFVWRLMLLLPQRLSVASISTVGRPRRPCICIPIPYLRHAALTLLTGPGQQARTEQRPAAQRGAGDQRQLHAAAGAQSMRRIPPHLLPSLCGFLVSGGEAEVGASAAQATLSIVGRGQQTEPTCS